MSQKKIWSAAYSAEFDHPFRYKPITDSVSHRSVIPVQSDHKSERSDAVF